MSKYRRGSYEHLIPQHQRSPMAGRVKTLGMPTQGHGALQCICMNMVKAWLKLVTTSVAAVGKHARGNESTQVSGTSFFLPKEIFRGVLF